MGRSLVGKTIMGYTIAKAIHSGSYGSVYVAEKRDLSGVTKRALKHISGSDKDYDAVDFDYIINEIKILKSITEQNLNQHIVSYYDNDCEIMGEIGVVPFSFDVYILMELLTPLPDYIHSHDLTVRDVLLIAHDILEALKVCNEKGIAHRDIKESNLFITPQGAFKLGDFGISKYAEKGSLMYTRRGTKAYVAPIVANSSSGYDSRADFYSFGIVMYNLLNEMKRPFVPLSLDHYSEEAEQDAYNRRMRGEIPPPPKNAQNELGAFVLELIDPNEYHYDSAAEVLDKLTAIAGKMEDEEKDRVIHHAKPGDDLGRKIPVVERNNNEPTKPAPKEGFVRKIGPANPPQNQSDGDLSGQPATINNKEEAAKRRRQFAANFNQNGSADNKVARSENQEKNKLDSDSSGQSYPAADHWIISRQSPNPGILAKVRSKIGPVAAYIAPLVVLALYVLVYYVIVPSMYESSLPYFTWLFSNRDNLAEKFVEKLSDPSALQQVLDHVEHYLLIFKVLHYVFTAAFIVSFYFLGRQLHFGGNAPSSNAILRGKDAYYGVTEIRDQLKSKSRNSRAVKSLGIVADRLAAGGDFGTGSERVIRCENEIAAIIDEMRGIVDAFVNDNGQQVLTESDENQLIGCCQNIIGKLKLRTEMKKK